MQTDHKRLASGILTYNIVLPVGKATGQKTFFFRSNSQLEIQSRSCDRGHPSYIAPRIPGSSGQVGHHSITKRTPVTNKLWAVTFGEVGGMDPDGGPI